MDRSAKIKIAGKEYDLVLTTRATKEIAARYGGLEELGDKIFSAEKVAQALEELLWLVVLLANQGIMIDNLKNNKNQRLLTEEQVELLTTPAELSEFKDAILEAMNKGTGRVIESEDTSIKNSQVE